MSYHFTYFINSSFFADKLLLALALVLAATTSAVLAEDIDFSGRYKMTVADTSNYKDLLYELGIGYFKRLAAGASGSEYVITRNKEAGTYTLQTVTTFSTAAVTFKSGEEFDEPRADGQTVKSTIVISGNKWTHVQKGSPTVTIERTFQGGNPPTYIDVITKCNAVTVTRKYERQ